jgi:hypothetical protein
VVQPRASARLRDKQAIDYASTASDNTKQTTKSHGFRFLVYPSTPVAAADSKPEEESKGLTDFVYFEKLPMVSAY